jgi:hypothetical protein
MMMTAPQPAKLTPLDARTAREVRLARQQTGAFHDHCVRRSTPRLPAICWKIASSVALVGA